MVDRIFRGDVPQGTHLDGSRDVEGAYRGTLRSDVDNRLVGHVNLVEISETDELDSTEEDDGSGLVAVAVLGGLALIGLSVSAVVRASRERKAQRRELEWRLAETRAVEGPAAPVSRVGAPAGWYDDGSGRHRWWDGQQWTEHFYSGGPRVAAPAGWYDDGSGRQRWWDGQEWTAHYQGPAPVISSVVANPLHEATSAPLKGAEVAVGRPLIRMTSAEWQERARATLMARAVSEVQWSLLVNARIEDADRELLDWQTELRKLTPQAFADQINHALATNPGLRSRALEVAAAGWYDDGSGRERWWDGQSWTGHFQDVPLAVESSSRNFTPAGWYDDGAGHQRWWNGTAWTSHWA